MAHIPQTTPSNGVRLESYLPAFQGVCIELFTPEEKAETEAALITDGAHLRALPLERLGYYGGRDKPLPVAVGNCFVEGEDGYYGEYYDDEADRASARHEAQLLAGALWRGCSLLMDGLFEDLRVIGRLERERGDVVGYIEDESIVLNMLPPASITEYNFRFVEKFLVIAADLTTKLARTWTAPSCTAQELAVKCLIGVTDNYLDEILEVDLEPG